VPALDADETTPRMPPVERAEEREFSETAATPASDRLTRFRRTSVGPSRLRLASVPNMLGDYLNPIVEFQYTGPCNCGDTAIANLPLAAGGRRLRISENNKALPMDRFYFNFHHFHNAIDVNPDITSLFYAGSSGSINRYTLGVEKTFLDGQWSLDVRLPLAEKYHTANSVFSAEGGNVGNVGLILKGLLLTTDRSIWGFGVGLDTPTGSDVTTHLPDADMVFQNESFHLSPFLGFLCAPSDAWFTQGFVEVDIPLNGNGVDVLDRTSGLTNSLGNLTDQALLHVDVVGGLWLYRGSPDYGLAGLAAIAELHYTTTVQDGDVISGNAAAGSFQIGNLLNRLDIVNVSTGLHLELCRGTTLRAAAVFPVQSRPDNPFDAEVTVSLNKYF
jgi:hypothetical protein